MFLIVWKTLIIALAFITAGSPWAKDETKVWPIQEPQKIVVETIEPTHTATPAPAETKLPVVEWSEEIVEWVSEQVVAENTTTGTVAENATVEDVGNTDELYGNSEQLEDDGCWEYSATCRITHYCNCARCCGQWAGGPTASGVMPVAGRTIAVDPSVIPLGSEVLINGNIYIAEDTGVSGYWIDIYCNSHSEALNRGMYYTEVMWR